MTATAETKVARKRPTGRRTISFEELKKKRPDVARGFSRALGQIAKSGRVKTIRAIKKGVAYTTFETLQEEIGVSKETLSKTVNIATRTLHRRKQEGKFRSDESERVYRVAKLFDKTLALFEGDISQARHWFSSPKKALGGKTPIEFADTELGAQEVINLIGRMEHGVFS